MAENTESAKDAVDGTGGTNINNGVVGVDIICGINGDDSVKCVDCSKVGGDVGYANAANFVNCKVSNVAVD